MWKEAEARHRKTTNNPVSTGGLEQTMYQEPAKYGKAAQPNESRRTVWDGKQK
jgi:hypothetical protein